MAASDENELIRMIKTSLLINDRPSSFRFPRGSGSGISEELNLNPLEQPSPKELVQNEDDSSALKFLLETGEAIQLDDKAILLSSHFKDSVEKVKRFITSNGPSTTSETFSVFDCSMRSL